MKLIETNWQPSDRQLRQFATICFVALPALGWLWGGSTTVIGILGLVGLLLLAVGMVAPQVVKPVFLALMIVATPIGIVIGELAMVAIYFLVFLPFAFAFRIVGRDALQRRLDRDADSYWEPKKQPASVANYYRQS